MRHPEAVPCCWSVSQPHRVGAVPGAPGAWTTLSQAPHLSGGRTTSLLRPLLQPLPERPTALPPSLRRPWRDGCDVPSARLSGRQPCHPDTCLTCLTRAMPVASPPCGLCVGRGWGPGLAPSGWTAGAWSWYRPLATGDVRWGMDGTKGGGSHPRPSRGPAGGVPAAPRDLRTDGGGPESRGLQAVGTEAPRQRLRKGRPLRRSVPQRLTPRPFRARPST